MNEPLEPPANFGGPPPLRFATAADGSQISYVVYPGLSPPFLIPHTPGAPALEFKTTTQLYAGALDLFRRDRSAVFFDWRGTGQSAQIVGELTIDDLVADLDAVTDAIDEPVDARAWGMACFPLCLHAAEQPERYRSIHMDGASLRAGESRQGFHFRPGWESDYLEFLQSISRNYFGLSAEDAQTMALRVAKGVGARSFAEYNRAWAEVDLTDVLPRIKTLTWVTARTLMDYEPAAQMATLLPNSILSIYQPDQAELALGSGGRDEWDEHVGAALGDAPSMRSSDSPEVDDGSAVHITAKEEEVLRLLANGDTNKQIATALSIAEGTVKRHVSNLLRKTGLTNRRQLMRFADEQRSSGV